MTVAGKINVLILSIAVLAGLLLTATASVSEFVNTKDRLIQQSFDRVQGQPQLPVAVYFGDLAVQETVLRDLVDSSEAIRFASLRTTAGDPISLIQAVDWPLVEPLPFYQIRSDSTVAEMSIASHRYKQGATFLERMLIPFGGDLIWDLTIPVFSAISPLQDRVSREEFGASLAKFTSTSSFHVIAYTHVGISCAGIVGQILPHLAIVTTVSIVFILLCYVLSRHFTRKITTPFSSIRHMADDVAAGKAVKLPANEKTTEFQEIATVLNSMMGRMRSYKKSMDIDHQLLTMKVEERTSQLTQRNKELNQAVKEITETKDRLRHMAYYDSLTSLPNRRLFTEQLDLLIKLSRRKKERIALLFIDLDNFKRINDSLGHVAGDLLLREAAKRLAHCVRESDLVAHYVEPNSTIDVSRLGGDEFTVVLNQLDHPDSAALVAHRLTQVLTKPMIIEGHELVITPSIGIAIAPDHATTAEGLLKASDTAMYNCKTSGKNKYVYFDKSMDAAGVERIALENDLRQAIEQKDLELYYQAQVDTLSGEVVGAEALMRWSHPELGMVPPPKFIALAEEMGLIGTLGEWALEEACRQMVELQTEGLDLPQVSVNVSALQFNKAFIETVSMILSKTGLLPKRLKLELTEGIMVDDTTATIEALSRLKDLGVRLSIDDFGTGYSSLSYLSRLPLDEVKIDRSFVVDMEKSKNDSSLVVAIIAMARSLGLELVAEGVETREQCQFLRNHGASVVQGYLFSKPVPAAELKALLRPGAFREQLHETDFAHV
ncbi:MAG: EAL domain-containing protein [Halioglobus sp.]|nr:EAL domain-containing protein [Halioglobus sp.]